MVSEHSLDICAIVSSDPYSQLGAREFMASSVARSIQRYRSGGELLRSVELDPRFSGAVVIVDSVVDDIAPLNLADALRAHHAGIDVVVVLSNDDADLVHRAMLAGARAAVRRDCSDSDLELAVRRVVSARPSTVGPLGASSVVSRPTGAVVAVVGARGGAGRSTLASLLAAMAARSGEDVGLLDFDLQFGDLSFMFGSSSDPSLYGVVGELDGGIVPEGFGRTLLDGLTLYTAEPSPDKVELLHGKVQSAITTLASRHKILIVSTGAFWTLLHAELLQAADQIVCVLDQSVSGIRATVSLAQTFHRLGVPASKRLFVVNRARATGVSPKEVARTLGVDRVWVIPDGGADVALASDAGGIDLVAQMKTAVVPAAGELLLEIGVRTSLPNLQKVGGRSVKRPAPTWRSRVCSR